MKLFGVALLVGIASLLVLCTLGSSTSQAQSKDVVLLQLDEAIDPGSAALFQSSLSSLSASSTAAVIIVMNTPGGTLSDMLEMINATNLAEKNGIPVYTYVTPGGMAASAGSYVAESCDIIYMAPGTFIGPSTPYIVGGGAPGEQQHIQNASLQVMLGQAGSHGRNSTTATSAIEAMVNNNTAYSAAQASSLGVVNGVSSNLSDFIALERLSGYPQVTVTPSPYDNFLSLLSNSFVDGLLITLGTLAIILDLYHGSVILSVVGIAAIALGAIGLEVIGLNNIQDVGLFFILIGAIVMVFEFKTGHGIALVSGAILAVIGAFLLSPEYISSGSNNSSNPANPFNTGNLIVAVVVILITILVAFYLVQLLRGFKLKRYTGLEAIKGKPATVTKDLTPKGWVSVEGQQWEAISEDGSEIKAREKVEVVSSEGLVLKVKRITGKE